MTWILKLLVRRSENLFRPHEVYLLIDSIEAMGFALETVSDKSAGVHHDVITLQWQGREVFRFDRTANHLSMTGLSGAPEKVYQFRWWRLGDWYMRARLHAAIEFYGTNIHRVRMQDYRAMFGKRMEEVIADLANLMTLAEAEARGLAQLDRAEGGRRLHPDIQRMLQTDAAEEDDTDLTAGPQL